LTNLNDPQRIARLNQLVIDFESLPESIGMQSTYFWLRDYEKFQLFNNENHLEEEEIETDTKNMTKVNNGGVNNEMLQEFLNWPEYQYWTGFVRFDQTLVFTKF
jgi:hypothetical protein